MEKNPGKSYTKKSTAAVFQCEMITLKLFLHCIGLLFCIF